MTGKRDYYEILGVAKDASDKDIAVSYRKLAMKYHPDRNAGDPSVAQKFKECAEAYEVLSDAEKRERYNRYGHAGVEGQATQFTDVHDIFEAFGDLFGGGFGDMFGQRRGGKRQRRGADLRCDVTLDLEEAAVGAKKSVEFSRGKVCLDCSGSGAKPGSQPQRCPRCGGRGQVVQSAGILRVQTTCQYCSGAGVVITDPCQTCKGNGQVETKVKLEIKIPAGIDDGMRIRIPGEGEPSPDGGPAGDAYCFVSVRRHRIFQRDGDNLILQLPITFSQAALGAEIEVPTLKGRDVLKVAAGTQSGEVYKLRGSGVPNPQNGGVGDLLVQTHIEVPKRLTSEQKELLRKLAETEHVHVSPQRKSFLDRLKEYFSNHEDTSSSKTETGT
jgi:molecular chaperone DnaJ